MLSEDEIKAIELLTRKVDDWNCKRPKNPLIFTGIVDEIDKDNNAIKTVLNLITRLQKENETTTKLNKNMSEKHLSDMFKIRTLRKENEKYKYLYQKALDNTVSSDRENIQLKEQIDLMAEYISKIDIEEDICIKNKTNPDWCNEDYTNCKNCIKQYFERKSEE